MNISLPAFVVGTFLGLVAGGFRANADEPREIIISRPSPDFLFGASHWTRFHVDAPKEAAPKDPGTTVALAIFDLNLTTPSEVGTYDVPAAKVEFGGIRYVIPTYKIIVRPPPAGHGLFVETAVDPNGTGNFEIVLTTIRASRGAAERWPQADIYFNGAMGSFKVISAVGTAGIEGEDRKYVLKLVVCNPTASPVVLDEKYFSQIPPDTHLPRIEIPPAGKPQ